MTPHKTKKSRQIGAALACFGMLSLYATPRLAAENLTVVPSEEATKQAWVANKGLNWKTSLEQVESEAKRDHKLVFWVHMLGSMEGAT